MSDAPYGKAQMDLDGRMAKAHLDKWQQYDDKAAQHGASAAQYLVKWKEVLSHNDWKRWLGDHGIHLRNAQRAIQEAGDPEKRRERLLKDAERKRAQRQTSVAKQNQGLSIPDDGVQAERREALGLLKIAPPEKVLNVHAILKENCGV